MARPPRPTTAAGRLREQAQYHAMRAALTVPQVAGLEATKRVARPLGRVAATTVYRSKMDQAIERLVVAMPELTHAQRRELVLQSYEHMASLAIELLLSSRLLTEDGWARHTGVAPITKQLRTLLEPGPKILVTGHCGNWEVVGYSMGMMGFPISALYRPLDLEPMDNWVRQVRARRGLGLIDKFKAMRLMPDILSDGGMVAIVADQNAGDRGLQVPFFNRLTSTYKSVGLMAMEFNAPVLIGQAVRVGPHGANGRRAEPGTMGYQIQMEDTIFPEDWKAQPDPLYYITARYRRGIERMIRRAPEQYLWMHRMWKSRPKHERLNQPFPDSLRKKLAALPWMDDEQIKNLVHRSDLDRAWLREHKTDRIL